MKFEKYIFTKQVTRGFGFWVNRSVAFFSALPWNWRKALKLLPRKWQNKQLSNVLLYYLYVLCYRDTKHRFFWSLYFVLFCVLFMFHDVMIWFVVFAVYVFCFHLMTSSHFGHALFMSKVINCIYSPVFMVLDYLNSSIYIEITYDWELSFKSYLLSWQLVFVLYWEQCLIMLHIIFKISNISMCTFDTI